MKLFKKLCFVALVLVINVFLIAVSLFFVSAIQLHKRFETESVAQAQVFAYSKQYERVKREFRSDLQFKTPDGQTIYLHNERLTPSEKVILEQGNAISRDYLLNEPEVIRPVGTPQANLWMAVLCIGIALFNFVYLIYWWRKH